METKICRKCKIEKTIDCFNIRSDTKKIKNSCKICDNLYRQEYEIKNADKIKADKKEYYLSNIDHKKEYNSLYYSENKDYILASGKEYRLSHADQIKEQRRGYYEEHKDDINAASREWCKNNTDRANKTKRIWVENNKEKDLLWRRNYFKEKRQNDPLYRMRADISRTILLILQANGGSKKGSSIKDYLPYTPEELQAYLESLFSHPDNLTPDGKIWMNRNNQGIYKRNEWDDNDPTTWKWQIDHIIPHSDLPYDSMDHPNFKKAWALENLRPLSAKQNCLDGARRTRHANKQITATETKLKNNNKERR